MTSRSFKAGTAPAIVAVMLAAAACSMPAANGPAIDAGTDGAHTARNSLDWAGAYRGVLPCADCQGIETVVVLADDGSYRHQSRYLGRSDEVFSEEGGFTWSARGDTVTLAGREPVQYFVAENRLIRLALDGSRITGDLAEHYVLTRLPGGITERYWRLVELNGQPVAALRREPFFILRTEGRRVNGFGGCNTLAGSYELDEATFRIRFDQVASTMMACESGMDVEQAFHEVLRSADNYSVDGGRLILNRARMAPLARFEGAYLH